MTKKLKVKAVIFDRDGVIINTEGVAIHSVREAFKVLGFEFKEEDISQIIGRSPDAYKDYFLKKWSFDFEEYRRIQRNLFYSNLHEAEFFNDTIELIKRLHSQQIPLAITTSASKEGTLLILKKAEIDTLFKVIVSKEDCTNLKPHPEPYILTAAKLGIAPEFCVAIEDTSLGVEAAKAADMFCIAIPNEYTKDQNFSQADFVLNSTKEVESVLEFI